jgi:tetratricopeptide (TPR) repeat protein
MKTKEIAITLPVVMALYEVLFFGGKLTKRAFSLAPFVLVTLLIPLGLAGTDGSLAFVNGIGMNENAVNLSGDRSSISRGDYLFTQCRVIVTYIRLLFFPVNQNIDYDYPIFNSFFNPEVILSFLFLLSVIISGVYLYRLSKRPEKKDRFWLRLISFGIFWFFITLSPESSVVPVIDVIFEHRVYLPSIGFFMALIAAIEAGRERWGNRTAYANKAVVYAVLTVMLALSGAAYVRNDIWKDSVSLWRNAVEGSPKKARLHHNLGLAYAKQGRTDEAINEFEIALKLLPHFAECHYDLGVAYTAQGRIDEAIKEYQETIRLSPNYAPPHNNLGLAYIDQGRTDDAIEEFQTLLKICPNDYPLAPKFIELLQKKKLAGAGVRREE